MLPAMNNLRTLGATKHCKVKSPVISVVTLDTGDIVRQDNSNAYGVVESGGNLNSISVVGVEGVFDTTNNLRKEGNNGTIENLSVTPTGVNVIYSNKPTWTSTLDGGTF